MLKYLMADANEGGGSSDSHDANGGDSSLQEQQQGEQGQQQGGEDTHAEVADSGDTPGAGTGEEGAGDQQDGQQGEEQQQGEGEQKGEQPPEAIVDKPEDAKLDFHEHPRFQELIREKNDYKSRLEQSEQLANRTRQLDQYCQQNGINEQQIARALEYYRLLNTSPMQAYEMLKEDYRQLATYAGDIIPPELQAEVASGVLSEERAKEIARARAQTKYTDWQNQGVQFNRQQQQVQLIDATINNWAGVKMTTDPDLKPGSNLWQYLDARIKAERMTQPNLNPTQATELVEKLYKEAKGIFKPAARPPVRRPPTSHQSARNVSAVIKSPEDVARAIMAGMKPHQLKYE